ncbi:MAG: DUF4010 domain-containing protein [Desulfovibrionaceae bacterium]|nr:DUF4010 domain-containing protein [Desulfovibrionaceae bacterium]
MTASELTLPSASWSYTQILLRLGLGLALGLLIGLERERRGKEAGVRTFAFIAMLGTIGGALGGLYGLATLALVGLLVITLNVSSLRAGQGTELTTSAAMMVTAMAGIMCGQGHTIAPAAVMVIATALLTWKEGLAGFSTGLSEGEVRSGILLAILAIVIYPALPAGYVDPWGLVNPRAAWVTVILIAGIGFFNYVLWKFYGARGTELSGFFGGLINSNFIVIELVQRVRDAGAAFAATAYRGILLATTAMVLRNATLLLLLAPATLAGGLPAFALMVAALIALVLHDRPWAAPSAQQGATNIGLGSPFVLAQTLKYGVIFLALHIVGGLMQRQFGNAGFYVVSALGGLVSSASAVAAAGALAEQGSVSSTTAGAGAVLATFTSIAFNLVLALRSQDRKLMRRLGLAMLSVAAAGLLGLLLTRLATGWLAGWLPAAQG